MHDCSLGIIFSPDKKKVLLLQRKDVPVWVLPGGGIDPGESPEQAVLREVYEETGLTVEVERYAAHFMPIRWLTNTAHVFECTVVSGSLSQSEESRDLAYYDLDQLPPSFFHYHREWLDVIIKKPQEHLHHQMSLRTFGKIILHSLRRPIWAIRYLRTRLALRLRLKV